MLSCVCVGLSQCLLISVIGEPGGRLYCTGVISNDG